MRIKLENIAYAFIFIGLFFLSGHSLSIVTSAFLKGVFLAVGFIGCIIINPKLKVRDDNAWFLLLTTIGVVLSFVMNIASNHIIDIVIFLGRLILAYYVVQLLDFDYFSEKYCSLLTIVTVIAIAVWAANELGVTIPSYTYRSLNGIEYKTILICSWQPQQNTLMGPFWESGLYSSFALFALFLENYSLDRKIKLHRLVILAIGIYLSKSAAGYLLFFVCLYIMWAMRHKHNAILDLIVIILSVIGSINSDLIFQYLASTNENVFWKLVGSNITSNTRVYSPIVCLQVFRNNFPFGAGLDHAIELYNVYKPIYHIDALTSTSTFYLAAFGIAGVGYSILMISGIKKQLQWSTVTRLLVFTLIFLIVNKEPHYAMCITYIILFYLNKTDSK